ncbi:formate dehydrogenase accessory sulfurtransferase FdhD [Colwellia sp. RSH04]|uniref:formate dehydrogenase accessory sulfurtransferase FdhD n=1 Tax=Colwellia sp. RSH04 TaxID=2305464 RepID=UPI000E58428B|nr:formate dehydrogenase accessory sulfurtransferase FdhD [Colwellia sp. RSH04]RHW77223.1 formate dehydrogenase accessory sulfurtransferase FdhD [Colwellia sp. RSH04]
MEKNISSVHSTKKINKVNYSFEGTNDVTRCLSTDLVIVEQPLQIRLSWRDGVDQIEKVFSITMRTPGNEKALILGLLLSEGIIQSANQIASIYPENKTDTDTIEQDIASIENDQNAWLVIFNQCFIPRLDSIEQFQLTYSSCGLCGTTSIKSLELKSPKLPELPDDQKAMPASMINSFNKAMRQQQILFNETGGVHAAALFNISGNLLYIHEDIGRHNAVDKVIGSYINEHKVVTQTLLVLMVSSRISFEIVQKALMAGVSVLIGVGAPSDLAIQGAKRFDLTIIGFASELSFNVYHGDWRITS